MTFSPEDVRSSLGSLARSIQLQQEALREMLELMTDELATRPTIHQTIETLSHVFPELIKHHEPKSSVFENANLKTML